MSGWFKLADDFHSHPKVVAAGRNGRDVFLWALARNRAGGFDGRIPAAYFQSSYLARMLLMSEREVEEGLASCEAADLLRADGRTIVIVGWDLEEWGVLTSTERVRRFRDKQREAANSETRGNVSRLPCNGETQERRGEEKRGEEKEEPPKVPQGGPGDFEFAEGTKPGKQPRPKKPKPDEPTAEEFPVVERVLERLSAEAGVRYSAKRNGKPTSAVAIILRRLREGCSEDELRMVVKHRSLEWGEKPEMRQYLTAETLFGRQKFDTYLAKAKAALEDSPPRAGPFEPISKLVQEVLKGGSA